MSYYFIKDKKATEPYFNLKEKLDYNIWVNIMEEYDITWDFETKHGQYFLKTDPQSHYKAIAYFDYKEREDDFKFNEDTMVYKTGSYSFSISFYKDRGLAIASFPKWERKEFLPLFFELSKKLDCYLVNDSNKIITEDYIKKYLPIPKVQIDNSKSYFDDDGLYDIRWLVFREDDRMKVQKALKLKEKYTGMLSELLSEDECEDSFVLTPSYSGWTFLLGDNIPYLLLKGTEQSTEEALTNLCKSLQKLSKKFGEVQYYEHEEKSNITGYFKANNGKLIFGYWHSETEDFKKGRLPKELKKIHPASAHEVASIWSIDTLDFVFIKKMVKENSYMVVPI